MFGFKKKMKKTKPTVTISVGEEHYIKYGHNIMFVKIKKIDAIAVIFHMHRENDDPGMLPEWYGQLSAEHLDFVKSIRTKEDFEPRQSVTVEL